MPPFDPASYLPRRRSPLDDFLARMGEAGGPYAVPNLAPTLSESPAPGSSDFMGPQAPTTLQNMQGQYNREFVNPPKPTFKQTLLEGIREFAPVAIGGLLGGEAGAAGAAGGVQQANLRQQALQEERRKEFARAIEEQKGREQQLEIQRLQQQFQQAQQGRQEEFQRQMALEGRAAAAEQPLVVPPGASVLGSKKGLEPVFTAPKEVTPRNIDPNSPEGIAARLEFEQKKPKPEGAGEATSVKEYQFDAAQRKAAGQPAISYSQFLAMRPAAQLVPSLIELRG